MTAATDNNQQQEEKGQEALNLAAIADQTKAALQTLAGATADADIQQARAELDGIIRQARANIDIGITALNAVCGLVTDTADYLDNTDNIDRQTITKIKSLANAAFTFTEDLTTIKQDSEQDSEQDLPKLPPLGLLPASTVFVTEKTAVELLARTT